MLLLWSEIYKLASLLRRSGEQEFSPLQNGEEKTP